MRDGGYEPVARADDIVEGEPWRFELAGHPDPVRVLVASGGHLYALSGICPHEQAELGEGFVEDGVLWCPLHSSGFDCSTGEVVNPPCRDALLTYPVVVSDGSVHVAVRPAGDR